MAIEHVNTVTLLEELKTDGHSPMKFLCDDGYVYFCKYRSGHSFNAREIDFLVYEVICHFLLRELEIPTPEIAFVELVKNSFDPRDIPFNKRYAKPGTICFGSKEIIKSNLITGLEIVNTKNDFKKYLNPKDLIRIAFFDLWVGNVDRGKEENFNLLAHTFLKKTRILAFDHAFAFHGENGLGAFNSNWPLTSTSNLARTSYFKSVIKFIPKNERETIAKKMLDLIREIAETAIKEAFKEIPPSWDISEGLKNRVFAFQINNSRIDDIKGEFLLLSLKPKK